MGHKGITPIIAIIILLLIAIALAGAGWAYISMMYSGYVGKNIQVFASYATPSSADFIVRNIGTEAMDTSGCTNSGKTATCGDITITKTQGDGDVDIALSEDSLEPGKALIIHDNACRQGMATYHISSGGLSQEAYVTAGQDCTGAPPAQCSPDGCNGNCPSDCTHAEDPDCGTSTCDDSCQNGDETGEDCGGSCISGTESDCDNSLDDDSDCLVDCADSDCASDPACVAPPDCGSGDGCKPDCPAGDPDCTCAEQNGDTCEATETCNGVELEHSGAGVCCDIACELAATCSGGDACQPSGCPDGDPDCTCAEQGGVLCDVSAPKCSGNEIQYHSETGLCCDAACETASFEESSIGDTFYDNIYIKSFLIKNIDNDDYDDIAYFGTDTSYYPKINIYKNHGTHLTDITSWLTLRDRYDCTYCPLESDSLEIGDINNDNLPEAIVVHSSHMAPQSSIHVDLYRNTGTSFVMTTEFGSIEKLDAGKLKLIDIDNDGDNDLIINGNPEDSALDQKTLVYLNQLIETGTAELVLDATYTNSLPQFHLSSISYVDVNNDNYPDMLVSATLPPTYVLEIHLYTNDGTSFTQEPDTWIQDIVDDTTGLSWPSIGMYASDINNDGKEDILARIEEDMGMSYCINTYINTGTAFEQSAWDLPSDSQVMGLAIADIDNNEYPDILYITTDWTTSEFKAFTNDGSSFARNTDWELSIGGYKYGYIKGFFDIDNDNDQDMVTQLTDSSNILFMEIYLNNLMN